MKVMILNKGFRFQPVSNCCDDILMMCIDINSIPILNIHGFDYRCIFTEITKVKPLIYPKKIKKNTYLSESSGTL